MTMKNECLDKTLNGVEILVLILYYYTNKTIELNNTTYSKVLFY